MKLTKKDLDELYYILDVHTTNDLNEELPKQFNIQIKLIKKINKLRNNLHNKT